MTLSRLWGNILVLCCGLGWIVETGDAYTWTADMPHGNASVEYRLKQFLMRGYDITSRPVRKDSTAIDCQLGMSLFHILDTSERHQTVSALMSLRVHWRDEYIRWNRSEYKIDKIWIPARSIWRPDLIITNYANDEYSDYINTNAIVEWTGRVMWTFPIVVKMYCTLDVRYFPFDTQDCNVTFMSWTYDGYRLNLNHTGAKDQKVYYEPRNQEWMVTVIVPWRENQMYPCCPEPFPVLHFTIHMYRRYLFYVINLICPCLLIYCVSFLGFFLPIESGEKVNLEITVLLALVVFLLMVSENMPPTPDAVPVVGLLFSVTMVMVALAVVMAVTVTFVFFAQPHTPPPAYILRLARFYRRWRRRPAATAAAAAARRHQRVHQQQHILCGG
uniref:Neur_chan_LBD domain-containing protein n=1 Tax=Macrostomum lignano TaxID=282301 RepID=A0A1I8GA85_9PLAT